MHNSLTYSPMCSFSDAQSVVLKPGEVSVHDVANVLKRFFRELSEPIVTKNQYERWIKTSGKEEYWKLFYEE